MRKYRTMGEYWRRWSWLFRLLSKLDENTLDSIYRDARDLQHREEDHWYKNKKGEWARCRMASTVWDDPYMQESGCASEFAGDFLRSDIADGCPHCTGIAMENASEPDWLARYGWR